ncbi:MAG: S-layer family protein [Leptolyngbyaceae cyanobacterium bins.302]|nr:S-layer family protein [Leptolyngbyaceae cyanobacterium bins.302]
MLSEASAHAQIDPDSTLGAEQSRLTPNVLINGISSDRIDGGAQRGSNLFHSFTRFNVNDGQRVYFANPAGVQNILTRVTGAELSTIRGVLGVDGTANLFLLNPNGILFTQTAELDVRGSFVATTANAIQFGTQGTFSADNPQAPPLLTVNPSAFVFNQLNQGTIKNQSPPLLGSRPFGGLVVPTGQSLLLVGGNVVMEGGAVFAPGGNIELGGLAATGAIGFNADTFQLSFPVGVPQAEVIMTPGARVDGGQGGLINITANNIRLTADDPNASLIFVSTQNDRPGRINLTAQSAIEIVGNRAIDSQTSGSVAGGTVQIQTRSLTVRNGGSMRTLSLPGATAQGGNLIITATDSVNVFGADPDGQSGFGTATQGGGPAGNVIINTSRLSIREGGVVSTSSLSGSSRAGDLTVNAETVEVVGTEFNDRLYLSILRTETFDQGDAGNLTINAGRLSIRDGGLVSTRAFADSTGQGGNLTIQAANVEVVGVSPDDPNSPSLLTAQTDGLGNAGNLSIQSDRLSIRDGGVISTEVNQDSSGRGGLLTINVATGVEVIGRSSNASQLSTRTSGLGDAGNLLVTTPQLQVLDGAEITASTDSQANGGTIQFRKLNSLQLSNNSLIAARSTQSGAAGNLLIDATTVDLNGQSRLSVEATQGGRAGNLVLQTQRLTVTENSGITVSSPEGIAGRLDITADRITLNRSRLTAETGLNDQSGEQGAEIFLRGFDLLLLRNGSQINASANNSARGGNVIINAPGGFIVGVKSENSDISANAFLGNGGRVDITAQGIYGVQFRPQPTPFSDITVSSTFGLSGVFILDTPDVDPSRGLQELPLDLVDPSRQIAQTCPRGVGSRELGTFVVTGRGGLPQNPTDLLPGSLPAKPLATLDESPSQTISNQNSSSELKSTVLTPIVEAQRVVQTADGKFFLVADNAIPAVLNSPSQLNCPHPTP